MLIFLRDGIGFNAYRAFIGNFAKLFTFTAENRVFEFSYVNTLIRLNLFEVNKARDSIKFLARPKKFIAIDPTIRKVFLRLYSVFF